MSLVETLGEVNRPRIGMKLAHRQLSRAPEDDLPVLIGPMVSGKLRPHAASAAVLLFQ